MWKSRVKHISHCCFLFIVIIVYELFTRSVKVRSTPTEEYNPWLEYGYIWTVFLYVITLSQLFLFPYALFNFIGMIIYNAFPDKVTLKGSPQVAPFICIRVVTKGNYKDLVRNNVIRNLNKCIEAGLENFTIEVVTDNDIGIPQHCMIHEVVVPKNYRTKTGAQFKARALQYCLEKSINKLDDKDWIVHLDEETLLTKNSIYGILNFVMDGKHQFGQGQITYANENVVNWFTTLADCIRVADDMGRLRSQFYIFHKPLFGWKGSFMVAQVGAEKKVTFDYGPDGSVIEDCFFAMNACTKGYSFNFIEGEMWEKSTFTLYDFVQQRKRWFQGLSLLVHSKAIPWSTKFCFSICYCAGATLPLTTLNIILGVMFPVPLPFTVECIFSFSVAVLFYMYIFGVIKSFTVNQLGILRFLLCICGAVFTIPVSMAMENIAVICGILYEKHKFYIVNKNAKS